MKKTRSISELKASARGHLIGNYGKSAGILMLYILVTFFVSGLMPVGMSESIYINIAVFIVSIILSTIPFLLKAGLYQFFMKICCNIESRANDLFSAFTLARKRNFIYALIIQVVENICYFPAIYYVNKITLDNTDYIKYATIALLVGLVINIVINLYLSQVLFLMFDFPDKSVKELIQLSIYLIEGKKLEYIKLFVSFIPIELVGILTLGIGYIWIVPYKTTTLACFYLDLTKVATDSSDDNDII